MGLLRPHCWQCGGLLSCTCIAGMKLNQMPARHVPSPLYQLQAPAVCSFLQFFLPCYMTMWFPATLHKFTPPTKMSIYTPWSAGHGRSPFSTPLGRGLLNQLSVCNWNHESWSFWVHFICAGTLWLCVHGGWIRVQGGMIGVELSLCITICLFHAVLACLW